MSGALNTSFLRKLLHHLYLVLFGSCFLLQQLFVFSHPSCHPGSIVAGAHCHGSPGNVHVQSSTSFPEQIVLPYIDIEIEPTDSDDDTNVELSGAGLVLSVRCAAKEIAYSKVLRTRLQRLASQSAWPKPVPVFILHHSWKAHLA